jgi:hypothetical protein
VYNKLTDDQNFVLTDSFFEGKTINNKKELLSHEVTLNKKNSSSDIANSKQQSKNKPFLKKHWKYLIGIIVTIGLMSYLVWKSEPKQILFSLQTCNLWFLLASIGVTICLFVIKTVRWQLILSPSQIKLPHLKMLAFVLIGTFGSSVTPAKVGDILRAYHLNKDHKDATIGLAVFSVVFDRLLDLLGIFLVILCAGPLLLVQIDLTSLAWWIPTSIGVGFVFFLVALILICNKKMAKKIFDFVIRFIATMFKKKEAQEKITITTKQIVDDFYQGQDNYHWHNYLLLTIISVCYWLLLGLQGMFFLLAFGTNYYNVFIIAAVLCIAAVSAMALPISLGGIGVRDGIIMLLLGLLIGTTGPQALNLSILQTAFNVLLPGLIGSFLLLRQSRKEKQEHKQQQTKLSVMST